MKKILCILFCMLLAAGVLPASAAEGPGIAAEAVSSAATLDEQLDLLYQLSVKYGSELENSGWGLGLTCDPAEQIPEDLLPSSKEVEETDWTIEDFRDAKFISLYNDNGTIRLLGDFQVRIPENMRASSLAEATAVLYLNQYLESRDDYVGFANNRIYDASVYYRGDSKKTVIYHTLESPPVTGTGTLSGDRIPLDELWNGVRQWFYSEIKVSYPEGTAAYRVTGQTCSLTDLTGSFTSYEVPAEVEGYPVTGIESIYNDKLEELSLPEGIIKIASIRCDNLKKLNFPSTLERISGNTGISGDPIQAADLNEGLAKIGEYCMTGGIYTTSFYWPSTLLQVGDGFLEYGLGVPYVVIPEGVETLPDYFLSSSGLVCCVYVPASVVSFGSDLFDYGNIRIYTPKGSAAAQWADSNEYEWIPCASAEDMPKPEYQTQDGFTYIIIEDEAVLTAYDGNAECLRVPDTLGGCPVAIIRERAFNNAETLRAVLFPDTVRKMEGSAVYDCKALEAVFLPASITKIHAQAVFSNGDATIIYAPENSFAAEKISTYRDKFKVWIPGTEDAWFSE